MEKQKEEHSIKKPFFLAADIDKEEAGFWYVNSAGHSFVLIEPSDSDSDMDCEEDEDKDGEDEEDWYPSPDDRAGTGRGPTLPPKKGLNVSWTLRTALQDDEAVKTLTDNNKDM